MYTGPGPIEAFVFGSREEVENFIVFPYVTGTPGGRYVASARTLYRGPGEDHRSVPPCVAPQPSISFRCASGWVRGPVVPNGACRAGNLRGGDLTGAVEDRLYFDCDFMRRSSAASSSALVRRFLLFASFFPNWVLCDFERPNSEPPLTFLCFNKPLL